MENNTWDLWDPHWDNSGEGPISTPGFGASVSGRDESPGRFFTCYDLWKQDRLTPREAGMLDFMNTVTDAPNWHVDVLDEEKVAEWRKSALLLKHIDEEAWEFCEKEIKDKAKFFIDNRYVTFFDSTSQGVKSDHLVSAKLLGHLAALAETRKITPDLYPLIFGYTRVLSMGGKVALGNEVEAVGKGYIAPYHVAIKYEALSRPCDLSISYIVANSAFENLLEDQSYSQDDLSNPYFPHHKLGSLSLLNPLLCQLLPCDVRLDSQNKAKVLSYINGLGPGDHSSFYSLIEELIALSLKPWSDVLLHQNTTWKAIRDVPLGSLEAYRFDPADGEKVNLCPFENGIYPQEGKLRSYDEWKHDSDELERHRDKSWLLPDVPTERDIQVIVEMSSVELDPETKSAE